MNFDEKSMSTDEDTHPIVNFLIGGVQKGGTTALHQMLSQHPDLFLPETKELHFFNQDKHFALNSDDYTLYHAAFDKRLNATLCGEATPAYIYQQNSAHRIKQYNPNMKWIILLRHPVERAYSQWNMQRNRGIEKLSFEAALEAEKSRLETLPANEAKKYAYADRGLYGSQIKTLLKHFDRSQCLFLTSENLLQQSSLCLAQIFDFLEVNFFPISKSKSHTGNYSSHLSSTSLHDLAGPYLKDIADTEQLTGLDLQSWVRR